MDEANIEVERWADIPGTDAQASTYGNIRRLARQVNYIRQGKPVIRHLPSIQYPICRDSAGYLLVNASHLPTQFTHRLVALAFLPNDDPLKTEVDHIDFNTGNSYYKNLQWITSRNNKLKSYQRVVAANQNQANHVIELVSGTWYPSMYDIARTYPSDRFGEISEAIYSGMKRYDGYVPKLDICVVAATEVIENVSARILKGKRAALKSMCRNYPAVRCSNGQVYPSARYGSLQLTNDPSYISDCMYRGGKDPKSDLTFVYVSWDELSDEEIQSLDSYLAYMYSTRTGNHLDHRAPANNI